VPANDTSTAATPVASLPFNDSLSTLEATTDAEDAALNLNCGAPVTEASVWYKYTPTEDGAILVDVSGSSYSAGILAATGTPGNLTETACGPRSAAVFVTAGEPVYIMAFDDTAGGANGGQLELSIVTAPPPPVIDVTVDKVGTFNARTGVATITGTATCSGGDYLSLNAELHQTVGRLKINGYGWTDLQCVDSQRFSIDIVGDNGKFSGGKAASVTFAFSCGAVFCSDYATTQTVQLRK
jgi:hypothetical protein